MLIGENISSVFGLKSRFTPNSATRSLCVASPSRSDPIFVIPGYLVVQWNITSMDTVASSAAADATGDIPAMKATAQMANANGSNDSNGSSAGDKSAEDCTAPKEVNGEKNGSEKEDGEDREMLVDDDEDMGEGVEEEEEVEEIGDESDEEEIITEENSIELDGEPSTGANSSVNGEDNSRSDSPQVCT